MSWSTPQRLTLGPKFSEGARRMWLAMRARGWSQTKTKKELGAQDGAVQRWLYGDGKPGRRNAKTIETTLGVPQETWDWPAAEPFSPPAAERESDLGATAAGG